MIEVENLIIDQIHEAVGGDLINYGGFSKYIFISRNKLNIMILIKDGEIDISIHGEQEHGNWTHHIFSISDPKAIKKATKTIRRKVSTKVGAL